MAGILAYTERRFFPCLQDLFPRLAPWLLLWFSSLAPVESPGQITPEYDEIVIYLYVRNVGGTEMPAYIGENGLYIPVTDLFNFLRIQNTPTPGFDTVSGYFIKPDAVFLFDRPNNRVIFQDKVYDLDPGDFIQTENNLYLRSYYFGKVFKLNCEFDFRKLMVILSTEVELPFIRDLSREMMRGNITYLKTEKKTDTVIKRNYPLFHFGALDWSVSSTQELYGKTNTLVTLNLGSLVLGGEFLLGLNYNNLQRFNQKYQFYQWHFANNDFKVVKQVFLGKYNVQTVSSVTAPVIGFQATNTPTSFNRSFGYYTITDYTEPGWIVELYVNYVLVDYVKADASGYFSFEVPLVYGNSMVKLRFYGPWGEERTREQVISIPYNFIPAKKIEYNISAGIVEDRLNSKFARAVLQFGVSRRLTIGGGFEYLSSVTSGSSMPFLNFSLRIASSMLLSGEYVYGVKLRGTASYRLPSNLLFELYYTKLDRNQRAIAYNYLEERKAVISMPVNISQFSSLMRLTLYQVILPQSSNFSAEFLISGSFFGITTNLSTLALFSRPVNPYVSSDLSLGFKLPKKILITPRLQYVYTLHRFLSCKVDVEKKILRFGSVNLSYNRNFYSNTDNLQVGLRYDFPFAQTNLSARYSGNTTMLMEYARGSMVYQGKGGKFIVNNYSSVGRGGIIILPFLDINGNGKRDKNEQKVPQLNLRVSGGRITKNISDSTTTVSELEPYTRYVLEIQRSSFDYISWQLPKATFGVTVNPNQYKLVEIPVVVAGEVAGFVYETGTAMKKALRGVLVNFYRNDSIFMAKTSSESDGYFSYLGLPAGSYTVRIDPSWLLKKQMTCSPEQIAVTLKQTIEGDIVDGLEFNLVSTKVDTSAKQKEPEQKPLADRAEQEKKVAVVKEAMKEIPGPAEKTVAAAVPAPDKAFISGNDTSAFHIQAGAFKIQAHALQLREKLAGMFGRPVVIILEDGLYKVRITGFSGYDEAKKYLVKFVRKEFTDAFVRKNR